MTILCLESSTKVCSVALGKNGKAIALKESHDEKHSHAENLTLYIEDVCRQAKISLKDIDTVAVSKGPGSFTGLRIGVSTAKGLCYALNKPLIAVNSLEAMAFGAIQKNLTSICLTPPKVALSEWTPSEDSFVRKDSFGGESFRTNPSPQGEGNGPVYHTAKRSIWEGLKEYGREMRKEPTKAEELLWEKLRNKKTGYKIRRQHAINKFICDFVCLEKQLVIELDGEIHKFQKQEDKLREEIIGDKRFTVLRFTNEEIFNEIGLVVSEIKNILDAKITPPLRGGAGGGAKHPATLFCPMIDAKRMEVYCAVYDEQLNEIKKTSAEIIDSAFFFDLLQKHKIIFFGDGAEKCKSKITNRNAVFIDNVNPSAQFMVPIAEKFFEEKRFENVAFFEPFYLKDFVGTKSQSPGR